MGASIAHELSNPLTAINAEADEIIDALGDNLFDAKSIVNSATRIKTCAERMRQLVDQIKQHVRKDEDIPWRQVNLNEIINESLIMLKPLFQEQQINLTLNFKDDPLFIWAHKNKLQSIIQNLLVNAKDAYEQVHDGRDKFITVTTAKSNSNTVFLQIKDNACGIAEENKAHIFEPFFSTKEENKGTGLGLAIVAELVQQHGGVIKLESLPTKGTKFLLSFPTERRS